MENDASKRELRRIIKCEVENYLSLKIVIRAIEEEFRMKITSPIDREFIESEYINCCKQFLLDNIKRFVMKLTQNDIQKVIVSLREVSSINQFQTIFEEKMLHYNLLMKHIDLMNKNDTDSLISLIKNTSLKEIYRIMESAKDELHFLELLIDFMSYTYDLSYFLRKSQLLAFCRGQLEFSQLVSNILKLEINCAQFQALYDCATQLNGKYELFYMNFIKLQLEPYTKPIKIEVVKLNDSMLLCITGMNIVLSGIKDRIESELTKNPKIDGVNFVVYRIFHIDDSLTNKLVWHGKNISCVAKVIHVRNSGLEWDVSGMDNNYIHPTDAGKETTGDGKNGSDGFAGESGGNISILAEEIIEAKGLTISLNGGNGSKGQDGGNGQNGKDGAAIDFEKFKKLFPTTAFFVGKTAGENIEKTLKSIKEDKETTQVWRRDKNDYNVEVTNVNGNKITFFHSEYIWTVTRESVLLYKGGLGTRGRSGGQAGLGGQGGYAGELSIQIESTDNLCTDNICMQSASQGKNGDDGKSGRYGIFGKNGWDVAWMDYNGISSWPKYYGEDENSTLKMEFHSSNSSDRVYCSCRNSNWKYAKITSSRLEHSNMKKFEERQSSKRQRSELQQQAKAVRQNAVLGQSMKTEFSKIQQLNSKSEILNLQSIFKDLQDTALQDITVTEEQELTQSFQVKVMRNTRFEGTKSSRQRSIANRKNLVNTKASNKNLDSSDSLRLLEKLENESSCEDHVGSIGELMNRNFTEKLTLLEVCSLSLFREIGQKLPDYYPSTLSSMIKLSARNAARYLVESTEDISDSITHKTLGTLRQYLCCDEQTQRENISKYLIQIQENRKSKNKLKSSLREFVLEVGGAEIVHPDLKKFYNLYEFHLSRQDKGFIAFPDAIDEYCSDNHNVYECFRKYLAGFGCKSKIYLNLLALIFQINLRVYYENESKDFKLLFDFNQSAKLVLHLSHKFERLTLSENLQVLIDERRRRCQQYQKIIMNVQMFHTSFQFKNYIASGDFRNRNHYSELEIEEFYSTFYSNEATALKNVAANFPSVFEMETRLEKLTTFFSGQRGILYFMEKHFAHEAIRISVVELKYIINYVLSYSAANYQNDAELFLTWIFAAHNQENWIDEVILLELEDFYGKQLSHKSKWRGYLSEIGNKIILISFGQQLAQCNRETLTVDRVQDILYLLSEIPNQEVNVDELELTHWPYALKCSFWTLILSKIAHWANNDDLEKLFYHVQMIENNWGRDFTHQLLITLKGKMERQEDVIFLSKNGMFNDILKKISSQTWMVNEKHLKQLKSIGLKEWFEQMNLSFGANSKERSLEELIHIILRNANTSDNIKIIMPKVEADIRNPIYGYAKLLADIDDVIEKKRKYRLRDTQKLAVLLLLNNEQSTLAQVSTGEGKTLIVVTATLIKALGSEKVDIVTSSSVLAKRDAEINSDIYKHFNIHVSHNCSENIEDRKTAYSSSKVVYGELANFQRDYLLHNFYGKNILGNRKFEQVNVIIDEVDSMLLDKGNNMLYLSHDLPGMDKLESVYIFIWSWMCKPMKSTHCFDGKAIREAVLRDLYGLITVDDISQIDPNLPKIQTSKLWNCLTAGKIVDQNGKLQVGHINEVVVKKILPSEFSIYAGRLLYLITDCLKRQRRIHMPNYLRDFVERHLDAWIQSALYAFFMTEGVDYVVDIDRTGGASSSRSPQIIILDKGTGTDQTSSQWDEALHQFLQLKHNCKITLQSLKAVFTSNVSFFKQYKNLYGLTGTLGSQVERDILTQIHKVDFFTVPTAKVKQLVELQPVLCSDSTKWAQFIKKETIELTKDGRSVLIIAETVKDAEELYNTIGGNARLYTREFNEFAIVKGTETCATGQVIIATNLAGRGTDIKISEELRRAGGLHVILAYLPGNVRIEEQAFGRTARCGDKGSAQLIIIDPNTSGGNNRALHNIFRLKNERDHEEVRRLSEINHYYNNQIKLEEYCFKEFQETYDYLKKFIDRNFGEFSIKAFCGLSEKFADPELKSILLDAILETWAFWLDSNSNLIQDCANKTSRKQVINNLEEFKKNLKKLAMSNQSEWVSNSPIQTVKLGLYQARKLKLTSDAIVLFNRVIEMEPSFSDSAHYYKAFVLLKKGEVEEFQRELRDAMRILNKHSACAQMAGAIVDTLKMEKNQSILQIDAYKEQQAAFAHIYELILDNIQGIFGYPVTVQSLIDNNIEIDDAFEIFDKLTKMGILTKTKVELFHDETVQQIGDNYGANNLKNFVHKNKGINFENEQAIKQQLKKNITLPSRESFFKNLVETRVLLNEAKLVSFDLQSLEILHSALFEKIQTLLSSNQLCKVKLESNDIILSGNNPDSEHVLVDRKLLKKAMGSKWYTILKQLNILSFHYKAQINKDNLSSVQFSHFDSITINDFKKINIPESEAAIIMNALVEKGILKKRYGESVYDLNVTFEEMSELELLSDYPVYENATYNLLRVCFLYRKEFERFEALIKEGSDIQIGLLSKPYNNLIRDLVLGGVLIPTKVSNKSLDHIEKTIAKLFPGQKDRKEVIYNLICRSKSTLETLTSPDGNLKPLTNMCTGENLGMAEEFYRVIYNGYEQLVELVEKKWTFAMWTKTGLVALIGLSQVAFGALLKLYPVYGNFFGGLLIEQGVSDLMFVTFSAFSGHLTWGDYLQHKKWSMVTSLITFGVGAFFKGLPMGSVYGQKIAGPGLKRGGEEIANMFGQKLFDAAGKKAVLQAVGKNIVTQAGKSIANGAWNYSVSFAINKCLKDFSNHICQKATTAFCDLIDGNEASKVFGDVHKIMGSRRGKAFIRNTADIYIKNKKTDNEFIFKTINVSDTLIQSLHSIAKNKSKTALVLQIVKKSIFAIEISAAIALIVQFAASFIEHLKSKLNEAVRSNKEASENTKDCESFNKDAIAEVRKMFLKEMESMFFDKVTSPLVTKGINIFKDFALNQACNIYKEYKETIEFKKFQKEKLNYEIENEKQMEKSEREQLKKVYIETLGKLMCKYRNPDLIAAIIREGIPMDMTCVTAAANVIRDMTKCRVIIIVDAHDNLQQDVISDIKEIENWKLPIELHVKLQDNHFEPINPDVQPSDDQGTENDCLYFCLPEELRRQMSAKEFRNKIAEEISKNTEIRSHIEAGRHSLPYNLNMFGGLKKAKHRRDEESTEYENNDARRHQPDKDIPCSSSNGQEFSRKVTNGDFHLLDRFSREIQFCILLIKISKETGIPVNKIIEGGRSEYQDAHSKDKKYQCAHVIRVGKISSELDNYPKLKNELIDYIGHTQLVEKDFNYGVGRKIDTLQSEILRQMSGDFQPEKFFNDYKAKYIKILQEAPKLKFYKNKPEALKYIENALKSVKAYEYSKSSFSMRRNSIS